MSKIEQVLALRKQGLTRKQIAKEINSTPGSVGQMITILIRRGLVEQVSREENERRIAVVRTQPFDYEKAVSLRKEGFSYSQIAEKLGISENIIHHKLPKKSKGLTYYQQAVIRLRGEGFSNAEIAEKLDRTEASIEVTAHRLIQKGLISRQSTSKTRNWFWHQFSDLPPVKERKQRERKPPKQRLYRPVWRWHQFSDLPRKYDRIMGL